MKQKKNTAAIIVSIIELVAVLGTYLTIGINVGLSVARQEGWIEQKKTDLELESDSLWSEEELTDWADNSDEWEYDYPAEPEETPAPETFYCPHCGAELWDEYATYCDGCGLDPNAPAPTPVPQLEVVSKSLDEVYEEGYYQIFCDSTWESSIVDQKGTHNNSASALVDGSLETSWQEGVSGDGIGESVMLDFGSDVEIVYVEMYLGNHRTDEWFYKNNVPSKVHLDFYGAQDGSYESVSVRKEDHARGQTVVAFNRPVNARYLELFLDEVYKGSKYSDTCIAEIKVYGLYK